MQLQEQQKWLLMGQQDDDNAADDYERCLIYQFAAKLNS
jgi:hypothetical protein